MFQFLNDLDALYAVVFDFLLSMEMLYHGWVGNRFYEGKCSIDDWDGRLVVLAYSGKRWHSWQIPFPDVLI